MLESTIVVFDQVNNLLKTYEKSRAISLWRFTFCRRTANSSFANKGGNVPPFLLKTRQYVNNLPYMEKRHVTHVDLFLTNQPRCSDINYHSKNMALCCHNSAITSPNIVVNGSVFIGLKVIRNFDQDNFFSTSIWIIYSGDVNCHSSGHSSVNY